MADCCSPTKDAACVVERVLRGERGTIAFAVSSLTMMIYTNEVSGMDIFKLSEHYTVKCQPLAAIIVCVWKILGVGITKKHQKKNFS